MPCVECSLGICLQNKVVVAVLALRRFALETISTVHARIGRPCVHKCMNKHSSVA
jgi:hypothetical protein